MESWGFPKKGVASTIQNLGVFPGMETRWPSQVTKRPKPGDQARWPSQGTIKATETTKDQVHPKGQKKSKKQLNWNKAGQIGTDLSRFVPLCFVFFCFLFCFVRFVSICPALSRLSRFVPLFPSFFSLFSLFLLFFFYVQFRGGWACRWPSPYGWFAPSQIWPS